jgi:hypothetical protein
MAFATGSDGNVTFTNNYNATLNTWSATMTRTTQIVTGYGGTIQNRRASGVLDITGSAGGVVKRWDGNDTGSDGGFAPLKHSGTAISSDVSSTVTLTIASGCSIGFDALINTVDFSVTNDGESAVTFNFELNDTTPTMTWDE